MPMATLTFQVPDDQLQGLGADADEAVKLLRLAAAFHLCGRGKISTGRAARLAGLSSADFLAAATRHEVDLYHYNLEDIHAEVARPLPNGTDIENIKQSIARAQSARG
jgi:predicted HTH domain antitoxin